MEFRHLRYFIKAAELLHFTKAAESLYISQPTLSIHIQQMEEELGAQLFARVGRQVRLTEAGRLLLHRARMAVAELETAQNEIDALSGLLRGTLKVASLPLHGTQLLPRWICSFNSEHPDVLIRAHTTNSDDIETAVIAGNVDLGFSFLPVEHGEIQTMPLFTDEIVLVTSNKHKLSKQQNLEASDLDGLHAALISPRVSSSEYLHRYFDALGAQPQTIVEFDDGNALLNIVQMSDLVTFLPERIVRSNPTIHSIPLPSPGVKVEFGALWLYQSPASKAFLASIALQDSDLLCNLANY